MAKALTLSEICQAVCLGPFEHGRARSGCTAACTDCMAAIQVSHQHISCNCSQADPASSIERAIADAMSARLALSSYLPSPMHHLNVVGCGKVGRERRNTARGACQDGCCLPECQAEASKHARMGTCHAPVQLLLHTSMALSLSASSCRSVRAPPGG